MSDEQDNTMIGPLDMNLNIDRRMLCKSINERYPGALEMAAEELQSLRNAKRIAEERGDHRAVANCVKTYVTIMAQIQADQHMLFKAARADEGKVDNVTEIRVTRAPKPLPDDDD